MTTSLPPPPPVAEPASPVASDRIDPAFRNGSLTAIGVVVGFSLGFVSNWASQSGVWNRFDIVAVLLICLGIGLQIRALAGLLAVDSLVVTTYERLVRFFLIGLGLTAAGVGLAIFGDVIGLSDGMFGKGSPPT